MSKLTRSQQIKHDWYQTYQEFLRNQFAETGLPVICYMHYIDLQYCEYLGCVAHNMTKQANRLTGRLHNRHVQHNR